MRSRLLKLVLLVIASAGAPPAAAQSRELVDRIVAIIDRDVVTLSEAEQSRAVLELGTTEDVPLKQVVERLIEARLIEREIARFSSDPVAIELVEEAIGRLSESFESAAAFEQTLRSAGLGEDGLYEMIRRQLEIQGYLEKRFRALTYVTEDEIEQYYEDEVLAELPDAPALDDDLSEQIRRILEERKFTVRVEQWIAGLKSRSKIRLYVW